jgi:simple sugar transport system ATP-binding protein
MRDAGCAVLLVSAELDEIMSLADRIAVICNGQILDVLPAEEATLEACGLLMAGVREETVTPVSSSAATTPGRRLS